KLKLDELMYISTCNRVEFIAVTGSSHFNPAEIVEALEINLSEAEQSKCDSLAEMHEAEEAVKHLFKVSSSLDSMVIGEREIITQVRKSYEECCEMSLTGDALRLVIRKTIETAKTIFTETDVFKKPVSVVSLAFHRLRDLNVPADSRILMIGAGKTNRAMTRFLSKHGYQNIVIFNRSLENGKKLAEEVGARAEELQSLAGYKGGFDVMITCTSASEPIITQPIFNELAQGDVNRKIVIDLAIPGDLDEAILQNPETNIRYIDIEELKITADKNLAERSREIEKCEEIIDHKLLEFHDIYKQREIELAMRDIPLQVKQIKEMALNEIYAKDLESMNAESREVLDRVVNYLEKKYISVPMKMAREVMLSQSKK
ncbi:MAG: glutamyl-tRNA reductase, partial [Flavobacteriales bacterium]|nr:glutamyl-tRNA reductase [Flavobacteriales bacterium]